jgi:hypothetical protein
MQNPLQSGVRNTDANSHAATDGYAITAADSDIDLVALGAVKAPVVIRGLSFGAAGSLKITTLGGNVLEYNSGDLAAGVMHPIGVKRIWASSTAARLKVYW